MNTLYPTARSAFLRGEIDWEADTFLVILLTDAYTYSAAHEFVADLTGLLGSATLTGTAVLDDGVADADDTTVSGVTAGQVVQRVVIAKDVGSDPATSPLVYYADENDDTTAINLEGDGGDIALLWSSSAARVFRL